MVFPGDSLLRERARMAADKNLCIGLIIGEQTHSVPNLSDELAKDLRSYQWRRDGVTWESYTVVSGGKQVLSSDPRDFRVPAPSPYCPLVRDAYQGMAAANAAAITPY